MVIDLGATAFPTVVCSECLKLVLSRSSLLHLEGNVVLHVAAILIGYVHSAMRSCKTGGRNLHETLTT